MSSSAAVPASSASKRKSTVVSSLDSLILCTGLAASADILTGTPCRALRRSLHSPCQRSSSRAMTQTLDPCLYPPTPRTRAARCVRRWISRMNTPAWAICTAGCVWMGFTRAMVAWIVAVVEGALADSAAGRAVQVAAPDCGHTGRIAQSAAQRWTSVMSFPLGGRGCIVAVGVQRERWRWRRLMIVHGGRV